MSEDKKATVSTPWVRRKRERALAAGLCTRCCCRQPMAGRRTCEPCNSGAKLRVSRARGRASERRRATGTVHDLEAAGDAAVARYAYGEGASFYEEALRYELSLVDDDRISEKFVHSMFYTSRPDKARAWIERSIGRHGELGDLWAIQLALPRQYWLEANTPQSLALIERARDLLGTSASIESASHMDALAANYLTLLGRYDDAAVHLARLDDVRANSRARSILVNQRAMIDAAHGDARRAVEGFDSALEAAKHLEDGYLLTIIWDDYANWSTVLGRLDIARTCRERALFVAREQHIAWRIPYLTLRYAGLLIIAGEYAHAKELLAEAVMQNIETPILRILAATIGAQLAYAVGDAVLVGRSLDRVALGSAFTSSEPGWIGPIAAAYARIFAENNAVDEARSIVSRAMAVIAAADHAEELLALAARFGSRSEAARARDLLQRRMRLPNAEVASAFHHLWGAYDASRHRRTAASRTMAAEAARHFAKLGWAHQQREALKIAEPARHGEPDAPRSPAVALGDLRPALSARELQVADLVLRGQTNRAIAEALSISEHTVESHMTSIFNRLGLRSRWQLFDLVK
jgi:ATP/maltotriose-dependent transcriptional regulator MalT